jgi:hypothetical protein
MSGDYHAVDLLVVQDMAEIDHVFRSVPLDLLQGGRGGSASGIVHFAD